MTETLAHGYSSESAQRKLSNEHQHNRDGYFLMILFFPKQCNLVNFSTVNFKKFASNFKKFAVWIFETSNNNSGSINDFTKYKEKCW